MLQKLMERIHTDTKDCQVLESGCTSVSRRSNAAARACRYKTNMRGKEADSPTVLRGQSKQFPIPKETRGTKKDHEDFCSVKLALWILTGE